MLLNSPMHVHMGGADGRDSFQMACSVWLLLATNPNREDRSGKSLMIPSPGRRGLRAEVVVTEITVEHN